MANILGYVKCRACGFADARVIESAKSRRAYVQCPECRDYVPPAKTDAGDADLRAGARKQPTPGVSPTPKKKPGRPATPPAPAPTPAPKPKPKGGARKRKAAPAAAPSDDDPRDRDDWNPWDI